MSWIITGTVGAGLLMGTLNGEQQRQQQKQQMLANAAQIQYSPWTGMKSNVQGYGNTPSVGMSALQGGVMGGMMGSQFGKPTNTQTPPPSGQAQLQATQDASSQPNMYNQNKYGNSFAP